MKIEGEAGGLALGCIRGIIDSGGWGQSVLHPKIQTTNMRIIFVILQTGDG